jgi:hypothetical protein
MILQPSSTTYSTIVRIDPTQTHQPPLHDTYSMRVMHTGPTKHTATRQWATHTARHPERPGQTYSMLGLPSRKDEENKQTIIQELHGGIELSLEQLTAHMVTVDSR